MGVLTDVGTLTVFALTSVGFCTVVHFVWRGHQQWLAEREELKKSARRAAQEQERGRVEEIPRSGAR